MKRSEIVDLKKRLFASFFVISNNLQVIADRELVNDDLTTKQWYLLIMMSKTGEQEPMLTRVAEEMNTTHQNAKQLAIKLQKRGFLEFVKDTADQRKLRLRQTDKCKQYWDERASDDEVFFDSLFKGFSDEEIKQYLEYQVQFYFKVMKMKSET
ncbi:MAG: hypothetical protein JW737_07270, partial [Acidobacteria bacterium]|nr:hypothetical protein [Acidobacteriota bacterium]